MTARPPFMSADPRPHNVSPSTRGEALSFGGTVSRWPARTNRSDRPSAVRATTLSPTRTTSSRQGGAARPRRSRRRGPPAWTATGWPPIRPWLRADRSRRQGRRGVGARAKQVNEAREAGEPSECWQVPSPAAAVTTYIRKTAKSRTRRWLAVENWPRRGPATRRCAHFSPPSAVRQQLRPFASRPEQAGHRLPEWPASLQAPGGPKPKH